LVHGEAQDLFGVSGHGVWYFPFWIVQLEG